LTYAGSLDGGRQCVNAPFNGKKWRGSPVSSDGLNSIAVDGLDRFTCDWARL